MTESRKPFSRGKKILLWVGGFLLLTAVIGSGASPKEKDLATNTFNKTAQVKGESTEEKESKTKKPSVEVTFVEEKVAIPYQTATQEDASILKGQTSVTPGVDGEKVVTYKITTTDGKETARVQDDELVTKQPVSQITKVGTKVAVQPKPQPKPSNCNPNYSGCVPNASDVDCAGGSGNGPAYTGRTTVIGTDIYDLDRDGDGVACE